MLGRQALAFLVAGNMSVAASGQGGLMVRVDPAQSAGGQPRFMTWGIPVILDTWCYRARLSVASISEVSR